MLGLNLTLVSKRGSRWPGMADTKMTRNFKCFLQHFVWISSLLSKIGPDDVIIMADQIPEISSHLSADFFTIVCVLAVAVSCPSHHHYNDVIMSEMASKITSLPIVHSTVYSGTGQRKYQSSASLAFVRGINRWPVNSPHKGSVTRKMFLLDDIIMISVW